MNNLTSCEEPGLLPISCAMERMLELVNSITEIEWVALDDSLDRILASPITSMIDVPAHTNSAMDGYALRHADAARYLSLQIIGQSLAGHPFNTEILPGTCIRITTGAMLPPGADCVVMQENTTVHADSIKLLQSPHAGENIRLRGEDIKQGSLVLPLGKRLGPLDIGFLASVGVAGVDVFRRPRVAVLSTGDELIAPGNTLPVGKIYDSNRYAIIALLHRLAVDVIDMGLIPDQPDAIRSAFITASSQADAVISSGGVSVGDADFVKEILIELGEINFWKVAIKPGKPFAFGKIGAAYFFGLPGNPVSSIVTLHQLAVPVLQYLAGEIIAQNPPLKIMASAPFKKRPGRAEFQRARIISDVEKTSVQKNGAQGSGVLTSFSGANCYVMLEQDRASVAAGEIVSVIPFDRFID
jgi:molybdopterin molybdotransferase